MAKILLAAALATMAVAAYGQSYEVQLNWTASAQQCASGCAPGTGPTLTTIYRATVTSGCTGAAWTQIATGQPAGGPFVDTTVQGSTNYCYSVHAYFAASPELQSGSSNWVLIKVPAAKPTAAPAAPTGAAGTLIQVTM